MMLRLRLSPQARIDLDNIWQYSVQNWNVAQAEKYLGILDATMKILSEQPGLGRSIEDIRKGYFKFPSASHLLIYRITSEHIDIIRILHKSSDVERHLGL